MLLGGHHHALITTENRAISKAQESSHLFTSVFMILLFMRSGIFCDADQDHNPLVQQQFLYGEGPKLHVD